MVLPWHQVFNIKCWINSKLDTLFIFGVKCIPMPIFVVSFFLFLISGSLGIVIHKLHLSKTPLFQKLIALYTIYKNYNNLNMCTVITCSCFLLHGTAWIKTKSETELIQRIRFLSKEYFFLLNLLKVLMLESISWGILLSITKERNMWTIFRCTIIQFQKVPYDLLILICLPLRDPDGKD